MTVDSPIHPQTEDSASGIADRKVVVGIDGSPASREPWSWRAKKPPSAAYHCRS
jgi:hypothetical protein